MSHTYYQNHAHVVFHTNRRTIRNADLSRLHAYIATVARLCKVENALVGGIEDHIHFLGNFPLSVAPSEIVAAIKANSSRWIKGINRCYADFSWQQGYGYFSVSASMRHKVVHYIRNQAQRHATVSAQEEFDKLKRWHETASYATSLEEVYKIQPKQCRMRHCLRYHLRR